MNQNVCGLFSSSINAYWGYYIFMLQYRIEISSRSSLYHEWAQIWIFHLSPCIFSLYVDCILSAACLLRVSDICRLFLLLLMFLLGSPSPCLSPVSAVISGVLVGCWSGRHFWSWYMCYMNKVSGQCVLPMKDESYRTSLESSRVQCNAWMMKCKFQSTHNVCKW